MAKIKLLFLAANPADTSRLQLDKEAREITHKIRAGEYHDSLELITRWAVRPDDLQQALLEVRPTIVHFSGHGSSDEAIILSGDDNTSKLVTKEALRHLFSVLKDDIQLVVLNSCYSSSQASTIAECIDAVVGMSRAIGDEAAILFSGAFYRALSFGRSVREAFELGRSSLLLEGVPEDTTPELSVRDGVDVSQLVLIPGDTGGQQAPSTQRQASPEPDSDVRLFYSYSHKDEVHRKKLKNHLAVLRRRGLISEWHDREITAGTEWKGEIDENLELAQVILLLISDDFLGSDYCYDIEMKRALERHEVREARVIPVILRDCDWKTAEFSKLQALPKDGKPVTSWRNRDEAYLDVAKGIRKVVEELTHRSR